MHCTLRHVERLTNTTLHHGFTDCCVWRNHLYVAYRTSTTHYVLPPGRVVCQRRPVGDMGTHVWEPVAVPSHATGDMRDPKFLATEDALYLFCGVYLPHPAHGPGNVLYAASGDNLLQTHGTFSTDGDTWSPLLPMLPPQYWGWSAVDVRDGEACMVASYWTGLTSAQGAGIALSVSQMMLGQFLTQAIYEGTSLEVEGPAYRYRHLSPSEPVLFQAPDGAVGLGCAIRTGANTLTLGYGKEPYGTADWRWHDTDTLLHPSAILHTPHGTILAGRAFTEVPRRANNRRDMPPEEPRYDTTTALWTLEGHQVTPLLTLPSRGDTGYAGLAQTKDTLVCSYYAQHEVPTGLPGAAVYLATIEVGA